MTAPLKWLAFNRHAWLGYVPPFGFLALIKTLWRWYVRRRR